jgi:hypothetical protein
MSALALKSTAHVIDVLGNVIGRDQPIMRVDKALEMVSLLGDEVFEDENVVFFDPFCKAGELLLACAFLSCRAKSKTKVLDLAVIEKEIYESNRYFGMAPDERHHRLSLRTFLGNSESHNEKFNHIIRDGHYVSEEDGRLDQKKFEKEFKSMIDYIKSKAGTKKIVAVGNPPYQESDGGFGGSATAIYNYFTETLMDAKDISEFIVVIPSRWFAVGKGVDKFREKVLKSTEVKSLHYFKKSKSVFPTVDVLGGVCFFHFERNFKGKTTFVEEGVATQISLSEFDIIPDDPFAYTIIRKIKKAHSKFIDEVAWSRNPYGLSSTFFRDNDEDSVKAQNSIKCLTRGRKFRYTSKSNIRKNNDKIDFFKVVIPAAYAPGSKEGVRRVTLPVKQYFILEKNEITTETYTVIDIFKTRTEAERFVRYLQTDFARYLLGLRKITQHVPKDRWAWVPYLDTTKEWDDSLLAEKFGLSKTEVNHMKKKVKEWS